jgi:3-oxoacyl-[acyl-carrier-protein] synthase III
MGVIRAQVTGVGAYLPKQVVSNADLEETGHQRRVDPRAHGHSRAAHRGGG